MAAAARLLLLIVGVSTSNALLIGAPALQTHAMVSSPPHARIGAPVVSVFGKGKKESAATPAAPIDKPVDKSAETGIGGVSDAIGDALSPMLTLETREDGWDDVRAALKERQRPYEELKKTLSGWGNSPAVRWAKVLSNEVAESVQKKK